MRSIVVARTRIVTAFTLYGSEQTLALALFHSEAHQQMYKKDNYRLQWATAAVLLSATETGPPLSGGVLLKRRLLLS